MCLQSYPEYFLDAYFHPGFKAYIPFLFIYFLFRFLSSIFFCSFLNDKIFFLVHSRSLSLDVIFFLSFLPVFLFFRPIYPYVYFYLFSISLFPYLRDKIFFLVHFPFFVLGCFFFIFHS